LSTLITQESRVLVAPQLINKTLSPVHCGHFFLQEQEAELLESAQPDMARSLYALIPEEMKKYCRNKKLIETKAGVFQNKPAEDSLSRSDASQTPHINEGDEVHFFFSGGLIIYFDFSGQQHALIVSSGDWVNIPPGIEHWTKEIEGSPLVIASYHSEPFETFHQKITYTNTVKKTFI